MTPVLQVVHRAITRFLLDQADLKAEQADGGAVTLIQRFGSAANLNIHLHCLVLDGVYRRTDGEPVFVGYPHPPMKRCRRCCTRSSAAWMLLLTRRGVLVEEAGSIYLADGDADSEVAVGTRMSPHRSSPPLSQPANTAGRRASAGPGCPSEF